MKDGYQDPIRGSSTERAEAGDKGVDLSFI